MKRIEIHYKRAHKEMFGFWPEINYGHVRTLENERLKRHTAEDIIQIIDQARSDPWICDNKAFDLTTILSSLVFNRLLREAKCSDDKEEDWAISPEMDGTKDPEFFEQSIVGVKQ